VETSRQLQLLCGDQPAAPHSHGMRRGHCVRAREVAGCGCAERGAGCLWLVWVVWVQPDTVTGNIVFVLQLKEHPQFKRKGDDLFLEHTLTLTEALCGFQFAVTHLDGRQLLIKSQPGEIITPSEHPGPSPSSLFAPPLPAPWWLSDCQLWLWWRCG